MAYNSFYNEILTEHNIRPEHKHDLPDANIVLEGVNPSCGDDIWLKLKVENDVVEDGAFVGDGCAISQASADIMLGMIVGTHEGRGPAAGRDLFLKMIQGEATRGGDRRVWRRRRRAPGHRPHARPRQVRGAGLAHAAGKPQGNTAQMSWCGGE